MIDISQETVQKWVDIIEFYKKQVLIMVNKPKLTQQDTFDLQQFINGIDLITEEMKIFIPKRGRRKR